MASREKLLRASGFTLIELLIVVAIIAILAAIAVPNFLEASTRAKVVRVKADQRTLAVAIEAYQIDYNRPICGWGEGFGSKPFCWVAGATDFASFAAKGYTESTWKLFNYGHMTTPVAYITSVPSDPFINLRGIIKWDGPLRGGYNRLGLEGLGIQPTFSFDHFPTTGRGTGVGGTSWGGSPAWSRACVAAVGNGFKWVLESHGPTGAYRNDRWPGGEGGVWFACAGLEGDFPSSFYDPTNGTVSYGKIVRTNKGVAPDGFYVRFTTDATTKRNVPGLPNGP